MSFAKIEIIGNLGADPEQRFLPDGTPTTKLRVAVSMGKDKDTVWYSVTLWRKQAEVGAQYLRKGSSVFVRGDFTPREYEKSDGTRAVSYDVNATELQFMGQKDGGGKPVEREAPVQTLDDIPF